MRKSRTFFIVAAVGVAILLVVIFSMFSRAPTKPQAGPVRPPATPIPEKILVATRYIPEGSELISTDMDWVSWPKDYVPQSAITNRLRPQARSELSGYRVRSSFALNEVIQESKLVPKDGGGWVASVLPNGQRLVTFNVNNLTGGGGFLQPKDKVDIVIAPKGTSDVASVTILLPEVYVFAVNGQSDPTTLAQLNKGSVNIPPRTITVQVPIEQANMLLDISRARTLYFNVRPVNEVGGEALEDLDDTRFIPLTIHKFDRVTRTLGK
jgi:Flp pilus assembly protein CpaB